MEARNPRHHDGLHVAQVEALVLFAESQRLDRQQVVRTEPQGGAAEDASPLAGQFSISLALWFHDHLENRPETRNAISSVHPAISASEIRIAATKRHRLRRTRLSGWLHFMTESTRLAGAATMVMGYSSNEASGRMSAVESNRFREVSGLADRACPAPAATQ